MKAVLLAATLAACGTDPKAIDLAIPGTQVLVTEKVNGGAWKKLAGQFDGDANGTTYSIEIGDEYELAVVCTRSGALDAGEFVAAEVFGTSEDADVTLGSWTPPNCLVNWSGLPDTGASIQLMGSSDESMNFAVDYIHTMHTEPGVPFTFSSFAGRHDVIAYNDTKLVIEHDVQLDTDTELAPIHLDRDGTPLLMVTVALALEPDETSSLTSSVATKNGAYHRWTASGNGVLFVPDEQLVPGDQRTFYIELFSDSNTSRYQRCTDPLDLEDPSVLPRLDPITRHGDGVGATWTPISEFFTSATIETSTTRAQPSKQSVTASKLWLDRHGKSSLDFDLAVDGYDPAWSTTSTLWFSIQRAQRTSVLKTAFYQDPM